MIARILAAGALVLAQLACSGGGRNGEGRVAPASAGLPGASRITWSTPFGPGGADVAPWPVLPSPGESSLAFSRLLGVTLAPEQNEVLFIGVQDDARARLDVEDLLDALAVAIRALPGAPGVSIDPTRSQLTRGLRARDAMTVRYIGGNEGSVVGAAAFEADRFMKCLSFGVDNVSNEAVTCKVSGFRTELDALLAEPHTGKEEWHRFWIEQLESPVEVSSDGGTLLLGARLGVRTEYMEVAGGALRSGKRAPSGSAKQFADHLTSNYDAYGREFPVYAQLAAFAQMTTLAHALAADEVPAELERTRSMIDPIALVGAHRVRQVDTPATTPAIVASREERSGGVIRSVALTGGVDLAPVVKYAAKADAADRLQADVRRAVDADPDRALWTVRRPSDTLLVKRRSLARPSTRLWQTDMVVGPVRLTRVSRAAEGPDAIGADWGVVVPHVAFSAETVEVVGQGAVPRQVTVTTMDGEVVTLGQYATLQAPGQPQVPGFVALAGPGRKRRALYIYRDVLVFEDGDIEHVSINGGPPQRRIPPGASVIQIDPTPPHRARRILTAAGTVDVLSAGGLFAGFAAGTGERIDLHRGADGRIVGLRGSNGDVVDYRLSSGGRLRAVVNGHGDSLSYRLPQGADAAMALSGELSDITAAQGTYARFEATPGIAADTLRRQSATRSNESTVFIVVLNAPAGSGRNVDVIIGKEPAPAGFDVEQAIEAVLQGEPGEAAALLRTTLLDAPYAKDRSRIVIVGELSIRNALAQALRVAAPGKVVSTAADPELAARNLEALPRSGRGVHHMHVAEGFEPSASAAIDALANRHAGAGGLVFLSGHNAASFQSRLHAMAAARELNGKIVFLATCGMEGGGIDGLLRDAGAREVIAFDQPIDQKVMAPFLAEVYRRLDASKEKPALTIETVVDDAIETLRKQPGAGLTEKDFQRLERQIRQIGRVDDVGGSPFVATVASPV